MISNMDLRSLRQKVATSDVGNWHKIVCWGGGGTTGPSFLDKFTQISSKGRTWLDHDSHRCRATYMPDVSVGIAWGLSDPTDERDFEWNKFPDRRCYPTVADLLWNGSLVYRYVGLVVDGGKAVLPFPEHRYDDSDPKNPVLVETTVTQEDRSVWGLINELEGSSEFVSYVSTAGFIVKPSEYEN